MTRPLWPEKLARRELRLVLAHLARFLSDYGYWPAAREISATLRANHGAVLNYLYALIAMELVSKCHKFKTRGFYELTPNGWRTLGLEPVEPWIVRPKRLLAQIAHKVTIDLADVEERLKERMGQHLSADGCRLSYPGPRDPERFAKMQKINEGKTQRRRERERLAKLPAMPALASTPPAPPVPPPWENEQLETLDW